MFKSLLWPVKAVVWVICLGGFFYNPFKKSSELDEFEDINTYKLSPKFGVPIKSMLKVLDQIEGKGSVSVDIDNFLEAIENPLERGCCGGVESFSVRIPKRYNKVVERNKYFHYELTRIFTKQEQIDKYLGEKEARVVIEYLKGQTLESKHICSHTERPYSKIPLRLDGYCMRCGDNVLDIPSEFNLDLIDLRLHHVNFENNVTSDVEEVPKDVF